MAVVKARRTPSGIVKAAAAAAVSEKEEEDEATGSFEEFGHEEEEWSVLLRLLRLPASMASLWRGRKNEEGDISFIVAVLVLSHRVFSRRTGGRGEQRDNTNSC